MVYLPIAEEWPSPAPGDTLIAIGEKTVNYRWVEENSPGGSCNGMGGFDQNTRHAIVAYWLGQPESEMKWKLAKSVAVVWTGSADFDSAVGRLVRAEEDSFGSVSDRLLSSGLLSKEEAAWARPKLVLHIVCHLKPCPIRGASTQDEPPLPLSF